MQKITNERRMQQALRVIQCWAGMAANPDSALSWMAMSLEMDRIAKLAEKTLKDCDEHDAKKKRKGQTTT